MERYNKRGDYQLSLGQIQDVLLYTNEEHYNFLRLQRLHAVMPSLITSVVCPLIHLYS